MELRKYQKEIIERAGDIITTKGLVYLAMEVRTGKTLTSLGLCEYVGADSVLFVTKKLAIKENF